MSLKEDVLIKNLIGEISTEYKKLANKSSFKEDLAVPKIAGFVNSHKGYNLEEVQACVMGEFGKRGGSAKKTDPNQLKLNLSSYTIHIKDGKGIVRIDGKSFPITPQVATVLIDQGNRIKALEDKLSSFMIKRA